MSSSNFSLDLLPLPETFLKDKNKPQRGAINSHGRNPWSVINNIGCNPMKNEMGKTRGIEEKTFFDFDIFGLHDFMKNLIFVTCCAFRHCEPV